MDSQAQQTLLTLLRTQRVASLGTLRDGAPEISMVLFAAAQNCSAFFVHISRLAHHTQNILHDPRVSLMVAETDFGTGNPLTLARVGIQGEATMIENTSTEYPQAQSTYLAKFPEAEMNFSLGDFQIYKIEPHTARFVAGFGQIYNLTLKDFKAAGTLV